MARYLSGATSSPAAAVPLLTVTSPGLLQRHPSLRKSLKWGRDKFVENQAKQVFFFVFRGNKIYSWRFSVKIGMFFSKLLIMFRSHFFCVWEFGSFATYFAITGLQVFEGLEAPQGLQGEGVNVPL